MYILNLSLSIILMSVYFYYNNFKELLILKESLKEIFFEIFWNFFKMFGMDIS